MDERDLISRAQAGDPTAFGELLDSYYDTIFRFAWRWSRHRANAEDIAQLACIKLANSLAQYRFQAAFATWLYRLVISCAQDWQRSQQRHDHDELFDGAALTDGSQGEDQIYLAQLLLELEQLGEGMKETALLVHAEGMSHAEAGAILGSVGIHDFVARPHHPQAHGQTRGRGQRMNRHSFEKLLQQDAPPSPDQAARLSARQAALAEYRARECRGGQRDGCPSYFGLPSFVRRAASLP